jgi:hypothetical protein
VAQILGLTKTFAQYPADRFALEIVLFRAINACGGTVERQTVRPHCACGKLRTCEETTKCRVAAGFWLGQGVRAAAIPAAVLPMLCIVLRAAFGRLSPFGRLSRPSNAGQAKKTRNPMGESKKGRVAALPTRLQSAAGMRPRVRLAIRPFLLSCGAF